MNSEKTSGGKTNLRFNEMGKRRVVEATPHAEYF